MTNRILLILILVIAMLVLLLLIIVAIWFRSYVCRLNRTVARNIKLSLSRKKELEINNMFNNNKDK